MTNSFHADKIRLALKKFELDSSTPTESRLAHNPFYLSSADSVETIKNRQSLLSKPSGQITAKEVNISVSVHMEFDEAYFWLIQSQRRKNILADFNQPMTAMQIARRTDIALDACLHLLWGLELYRVLYCLNTDTRYSRLYWLTELGKACQRKLREALGLRPLSHHFPNVSWDLYSQVCYSHRSAVIKAMHGSMQATNIKRKALSQNPLLRMSANNVRDVMRHLLKEKIVCKVMVAKKAHPRFELTGVGKTFKELLVGARDSHTL